jgi:hypothetical protein
MNTLNFFITPDYPSGALDNKCGPLQNVECRGWDSDQVDEFTRQRTKLLAGIADLNADIVGLNELENTPGVEPLASLAGGLADYSYIDTGTIGTEAIRAGMIYRPAAVTPIGAFRVLDSTVDPRFLDTKSRPTLAQTFEVNATGARFTVVMNHFKSKGSDCNDVGDPDLGDGQGNCSETRKAAAAALVDWLATDPTGSGDPDFLVIGDLNSYAREDSITAIKAGPDDAAGTTDDFVNLLAQYQGTYAYTYTFDGQAGYLDQALANASLAPQVTGVATWHINSDEPDVLDYDTSFKPAAQDALYEANAYRSSDHDAVVIGLEPNAAPTVDAGGPYTVTEGGSATLTATASDPNGDTLTYAWDLDNNGSFETAGQSVTFDAALLAAPGSYTVRAKATDTGGLSAVDEATVIVIFNWTGFFQPVDNLPNLNQVKAGSAIPVKFSLGGNKGLGIFAASSPTSYQVACASGSGEDLVEQTLTSGGSSLSYDASSGQYIYVWKTDKAWASTCRELEVKLQDGTTHYARFHFTR